MTSYNSNSSTVILSQHQHLPLPKRRQEQTCFSHAGIREPPTFSHDCTSGDALASCVSCLHIVLLASVAQLQFSCVCVLVVKSIYVYRRA